MTIEMEIIAYCVVLSSFKEPSCHLWCLLDCIESQFPWPRVTSNCLTAHLFLQTGQHAMPLHCQSMVASFPMAVSLPTLLHGSYRPKQCSRDLHRSKIHFRASRRQQTWRAGPFGGMKEAGFILRESLLSKSFVPWFTLRDDSPWKWLPRCGISQA